MNRTLISKNPITNYNFSKQNSYLEITLIGVKCRISFVFKAAADILQGSKLLGIVTSKFPTFLIYFQ